MNVKDEKDRVRKEILRTRDSLTEDFVNIGSRNILDLFTLHFLDKPYENYMSYVGIGNEAHTKGIIKTLLKKEKNVSVPLCIPKDRDLIASQIYNINELKPSYFGLLEPEKDCLRPVEPEDIEIVLVPGLAFDRKGNRLGYGMGYYDRFLKKLNPGAIKIGLAFSFQILQEVPVGPLDHSLDLIITDEEIITLY